MVRLCSAVGLLCFVPCLSMTKRNTGTISLACPAAELSFELIDADEQGEHAAQPTSRPGTDIASKRGLAAHEHTNTLVTCG